MASSSASLSLSSILLLLSPLLHVTAIPVDSAASHIPITEARQAVHNDFSCRSAQHPNPVVLLHGLGATYYEDLNLLESFLQSGNFCTFSLTYGDYPGFPYVGGLEPISTSATEISSFISSVISGTGASKIDLVGHSEGAFQTLYVAKFGTLDNTTAIPISSVIDHIVAIAPPTHGTTFGNLYNLTYAFVPAVTQPLVTTVLNTFGCDACNDLLPTGPAVQQLNDGNPIIQPGNDVTIIVSKYDELVTPVPTASFVYNEAGVANEYVQDYCPDDPVGHIGEAYDQNVWNLVLNALEDMQGRTFDCVVGSPGK